MAGIGDIVQKAFYLGVGLASYATEKAGFTLQELRSQAQKLAEDMVARGEMTAEEARKYVDDLVQQAQQATTNEPQGTEQPKGPRLIEIVSEDEEPAATADADVESLRQQVQSLEQELGKLKRE